MSLLNLFNDVVLAASSSQNASGQPSGAASGLVLLIQLLPFILMIAVFYILIIVPQRRREKQFRDMVNSLIVGDEIVTNGGIVGKVVNIKDDILTIEVGADKVKLRVYKWAVKEVLKKAEPKE